MTSNIGPLEWLVRKYLPTQTLAYLVFVVFLLSFCSSSLKKLGFKLKAITSPAQHNFPSTQTIPPHSVETTEEVLAAPLDNITPEDAIDAPQVATKASPIEVKKYYPRRFIMPITQPPDTDKREPLVYLPVLENNRQHHQNMIAEVSSHAGPQNKPTFLSLLSKHRKSSSAIQQEYSPQGKKTHKVASLASIRAPNDTSLQHEPKLQIVLLGNDIFFPHLGAEYKKSCQTKQHEKGEDHSRDNNNHKYEHRHEQNDTNTNILSTSGHLPNNTQIKTNNLFSTPLPTNVLNTLFWLCQPSLNYELFLIFYCKNLADEEALLKSLKKYKILNNLVLSSHILICQHYDTVGSYLRHLLPNVVICTDWSDIKELKKNMVPYIYLISTNNQREDDKNSGHFGSQTTQSEDQKNGSSVKPIQNKNVAGYDKTNPLHNDVICLSSFDQLRHS
jgi:hypothetical protein